MEKFFLRADDEYIKLGQLIKACGMVENGAMAKMEIQYGNVLLNGVKEYQRGRKVKEGDIVEFDGEQILVCK